MITDEMLDQAEAFLDEFKALVRKYVPNSESEDSLELLCLLQERTSVYNPYIWSDS